MGNEVFVFAGISVLLSIVMLTGRRTYQVVSAGALATVSWYITGIWFMHDYVMQNPTNPSGLVFGRFFQLFALICLVITLVSGGWYLDPYNKHGGILSE